MPLSGADFKWNKNARNKSFLYPVTNGAARGQLAFLRESWKVEVFLGGQLPKKDELTTAKLMSASTVFFFKL